MNARWNRFTQLVERFYDDDADTADYETQLTLFKIFQQTLRNLPGRSRGKKPTIHEIDQDADGDVIPFLMDFLMDIYLQDQFGMLARACSFLLENLSIDEDEEELLDVRSYYAEALCRTGRAGEALAFCDQWRKEYPGDMTAAAIYIMTCIFNGKLEEGRACALQWFADGDECTEENEEIFRAVQRLMDAMGEEKKAVSMLQSIEDFEDYEDMSFYDDDFDPDDFDEDDEDIIDEEEDSDDGNVFRFPSGPELF